jgi:N-acetylneuraminic acid mutarotase
VIGGRNETALSEIWLGIAKQKLWYPNPRGISALYSQSAVVLNNERIFVFGGKNIDDKLTNDLYSLSLSNSTANLSLKIREINCAVSANSSVPSPRCGHSCVLYNRKMIVFGGETEQGLSSEVWVYTIGALCAMLCALCAVCAVV